MASNNVNKDFVELRNKAGKLMDILNESGIDAMDSNQLEELKQVCLELCNIVKDNGWGSSLSVDGYRDIAELIINHQAGE